MPLARLCCLQTAIKVVKRQDAAKAAAAASPAPAAAAPAEEATPTRRLQFDQARRAGCLVLSLFCCCCVQQGVAAG